LPSEVLRDISPQLSNGLLEYIGKAVNSYNPDRDKLARELAEAVSGGVYPLCDPSGSETERNKTLAKWQNKARQLLKLYAGEKP